MAFQILASLALFGTAALAKTDLAGCTYIDGVFTPDHGPAWATRTWYVPDTGEICAFLDCGGGRAPPKTTVPGCAAYEGTETYSPLFLDLASITGGGDEVVQTSTNEVVEATTTTTTTEAEEASSTSEEGGDDVALQTTLPSSLATVTSSETSSTESESSAETSAETSPATTSAPESTTAQTTTSDVVTTTPVLGGGDGEGAAAAPAVALLGSTFAAGMAVWFAMF